MTNEYASLRPLKDHDYGVGNPVYVQTLVLEIDIIEEKLSCPQGEG